MTRDTITALPDPNGFSTDPLTDLIRSGARQLIEQALAAELSTLLAQFSNETTPGGHARVVRHGHLPEREIMTCEGAARAGSGIAGREGAPHAVDPAALSAQDRIRRGTFALAVSQRPFHGRFSGRAGCTARAERGGAFRTPLIDLAIGDGAPGFRGAFWGALREVFGSTAKQRCWLHKTGNVLNAMRKSVQAKAKGCLSRKTGLAMACRLMISAQSKWRKLDGANRMPEIVQGSAFKDGIKQLQDAAFKPSPTFGHSSRGAGNVNCPSAQWPRIWLRNCLLRSDRGLLKKSCGVFCSTI